MKKILVMMMVMLIAVTAGFAAPVLPTNGPDAIKINYIVQAKYEPAYQIVDAGTGATGEVGDYGDISKNVSGYDWMNGQFEAGEFKFDIIDRSIAVTGATPYGYKITITKGDFLNGTKLGPVVTLTNSEVNLNGGSSEEGGTGLGFTVASGTDSGEWSVSFLQSSNINHATLETAAAVTGAIIGSFKLAWPVTPTEDVVIGTYTSNNTIAVTAL